MPGGSDKKAFLLKLGDIINSLLESNPFFIFSSSDLENPIIPYLHQVELFLRVIFRRPVRVLIADEIGLGKTISALMILKKLINSGEVKRALILVPRILMTQWYFEIQRSGLGVPKRIERDTIDLYSKEGFLEGIYLASMDLIKFPRYFEKVKDVSWDIIIVDEAHRLGAKKDRITMRFESIGAGLIEKFPQRHALLLSATPHRGDPFDYNSRLRILDPFLVPADRLDNPLFYARTNGVLVFRRTKIDVNDIYEQRKVFPDCRLEAIIVRANQDEVEFHDRLISFLRTKLLEFYSRARKQPKALGLLMALIFKRASSSPAAAISTMERIILKRSELLKILEKEASVVILSRELEKRSSKLANTILGLGYEDYSEELFDSEIKDLDDVLNDFAEKCSVFLSDRDIEEIRALVELAKRIKNNDSRLKALLKLIDLNLSEGRKIVIFTEYKDTVQYLYKAISNAFGENIAVIVTGDTVRDQKEFINIKRRFEKDPSCKILIATDVASEGLNLQVASIVINYEPPWSPIKLEQRMGRVWRLGQKRDVKIYNIFLTVKSDKDVLDVLYKKLIAMGRAFPLKKPPLGEEVYYIDFNKEDGQIMIPITVKERNRRVRITEYKLINQYIREGRAGLERLVNRMIRAIRMLKENLERLNLLAKPNREDIEMIIKSGTGFLDFNDYNNSLLNFTKKCLEVASNIGLIRAYNRGDIICVLGPAGGEVCLENASAAITLLKMLYTLLNEDSSKPKIFGVIGNLEGRLIVTNAQVFIGSSKVFEMPFGVFFNRGSKDNIYYGKRLLDILSIILAGKLFVIDDIYDADLKLQLNVAISKAKRYLRETTTRILRPYVQYLRELNELHFRRSSDSWMPDENYKGINLYVEDPLLIVEFMRPDDREFNSINENVKRDVEEIAMQYALKYEIENGRKPQRVDDREHYDIYSIDPNTGEERYIEVKGHSDSVLVAELTESEYKFAEKYKDKYWLYIVHSIKTGKPKLITIRNPIDKLKIEIKEEVNVIKRRKYVLKV